MTALLERAFAEAKQLPAEAQDALAARLLADIADDQAWDARFASTTDDQWDRLAASVRGEIAAGRTTPLDAILPSSDP